MDVNQVLHMNGGAGEDSYAKNSTVQNDILSLTKPYTEQALEEFFRARGTVEGIIGIADLGCSSGPNALAAMSHVLEVVHAAWRRKGGEWPEVAVYLNDLPGNDFNNVFVSLPEFFAKMREEKGLVFDPCLVFGAPGSFHGRLFPAGSLHLVHSSSSLHWLSELPPGLDPNTRPTLNKGKINISKMSSEQVVEAYTKQFQHNFSSLLESRSKEVVTGGRMVFSFMGRASIDPTEDEDSYLQWELIARSLMTMVSEGIVEEEKVDSLNIPYYAACSEEIKDLVQAQGSFEIDHLRAIEINWGGCHGTELESDEEAINGSKPTRGETIAKTHRAVVEPILEYHFGESVMDELFNRYSMMLDSYLSIREPRFINLIISLLRKPH